MIFVFELNLYTRPADRQECLLRRIEVNAPSRGRAVDIVLAALDRNPDIVLDLMTVPPSGLGEKP